jgi:predicted alpha/beta-fold hydrolase
MDSVVAVSPPLDLVANSNFMEKPENNFSNRYFSRRLRDSVDRLHQHHTDLPHHNLPLELSLRELDEIYIAPRSGFKDAMDYYRKSSSKYFLDKISVPVFILCSNDDPIVELQAYKERNFNSFFDVLLTDKGGHMGFIGKTGSLFDFRWMDHVILNWLNSNKFI